MTAPELLAPAGGEETARIALSCGADAVYLGLSRFSARSAAENFDSLALSRTAEFAHLLGAKVYVCLNTLVKESELCDFFDAARTAWAFGADAILLQDPFLGYALKKMYPQICLHLSTQGGCCNEWGARFAKDCGFSRAVLARETPLCEIEKISKVLETEVFVQGALCASFSGQCYLSSFAGNNSGNRGRCKQPCRKRYSIDRKGYENFCYALSPSDLSVGERVHELICAGVSSLKIEGRMRRPDYVAAAVNYFRALLSGRSGEEEKRDLTRAFNRGDYTEGLAFGQGKDFLSQRVQGHIGEKVGVLRPDLFCESDYRPQRGDGFKILRRGAEVGGAVLDEKKTGRGGFTLTSKEPLKPFDEVRLTTEKGLLARIFRPRKRKIPLEIQIFAGEPARVRCGDFLYLGETFPQAVRAPLSPEEIEACFEKTDALPFSPEFVSVKTEGAFAPKSALNALRRDFYEALKTHLLPPREELMKAEAPNVVLQPNKSKEKRSAIIAGEKENLSADILVYKPRDYAKIEKRAVERLGKGEKYLYLPAFFGEEDLKLILPALEFFDGVYSEGAYGLKFSKEHGKKCFLGTGLNLTNRLDLYYARAMGADFCALSKELSRTEQEALSAAGTFVLNQGAIKVMDLCFCPFQKTCALCDKRELYRMTDEEGRVFPLRRYRAAKGACRFEVYNCAPLAFFAARAGELCDLTLEVEAAPTKGHAERSML